MNRRDVAFALTAAGLAAAGPAAWAQGGPVEGQQYARLPQPLPGAPGKVEVVEFFLYTCPHCYAFDPALSAWVQQQPADVSFRRVPVGDHAMLKLHQRLFYAMDAMGALTPAMHASLFNAFHRGGAEVADEAGAVALAGKLGADTGRFKQTFNSFGVQTRVTQGLKLAQACEVSTVPALVVAGRWRTGPGMGAAAGQDPAASGRQALATADFLIKQARSGKLS